MYGPGGGFVGVEHSAGRKRRFSAVRRLKNMKGGGSLCPGMKAADRCMNSRRAALKVIHNWPESYPQFRAE